MLKPTTKTMTLKPKAFGFTLLEVLIAMVIFGTAIVFLLQHINEQKLAHKNITEKTIAHWVAMNKMNETRMDEKWPDIGTSRGDIEMRNHEWSWLQTVSKTSEKDLRQVEIEVRYDEKDKLPTTRFIGFIAKKS